MITRAAQRTNTAWLGGRPMERLADANTFICDVGKATGNVTGVGAGLSGANLILTEAGSPGGAARGARTGASELYLTAAALNAVLASTTWSVFIRLNWPVAATSTSIFYAHDSGAANYIKISTGAASGSMQFQVYKGGGTTNETDSLVSCFADGEWLWVCASADGANGIRFGATRSRGIPMSYTALEHSTELTDVGDLSAVTFTAGNWVCGTMAAAKASCVVFSKSGLLA